MKQKKNNSKSKEIKQLQLEKNNTPLAKCGEKKRSNLKREKMLGICEIGYVEREVGEEIEIFTKLTKHTSRNQKKQHNSCSVIFGAVAGFFNKPPPCATFNSSLKKLPTYIAII